MKHNDLEGRLARALTQAAPNDPEAVLSRCQPRKGTVINMTRSISIRKSAIAAGLALCLILGGMGFVSHQLSAVASVVSLDVNPSIELKVNRREQVLSCAALNEEAALVLSGMAGGADLKGTGLNVAVNAIVGALVGHGYLEDISSAILISVEDRDLDRAARLRQQLTASVDNVLQNRQSQAAVLSQTVTYDDDLEQQAKAHNISTGKAALIRDIQALNSDLPFEGLAALSVEELKDLAELGAPAMPIGKEQAAQIALLSSKLGIYSSTYYEVDPELDEAIPHYEVELISGGGAAEVKVHAFTGQIIGTGGAPIGQLPGATGPTIPADPPASQPTQPPAQPSQTDIGSDAALEKALAHAGLTRSAVTHLEVERDMDDGQLEYEVEFTSGGMEYDYTIHGVTGAILSRKLEPMEGFQPIQPTQSHTSPSADPPAAEPAATEPAAQPPAAADIGRDSALQAALSHAGLARSAVTHLNVERDMADGRLEYEVEFQSGAMEYEYTIDGRTGAILEHEKDLDD